MWPYTVAILIGGKSSRMGSPKHEVTLPNGKTMMEAMLEFASTTANKTVVVGGTYSNQHCILDHRKGFGPVAGIEALLRSNLDERYLVVGCDMPLLKLETVRPLFGEGDVVVFEGDSNVDFPTPLPLVVSSLSSNACSTYLDEGGRSLHGFLRTLVCTVVPRPRGAKKQLSNINTREQLNNCTFEDGCF
mgnify:FL=1